MQRIYEPQDLLEAELLLGMLASEGVEAHLAGRHLLGAVGELPALGLPGAIRFAVPANQRQLAANYRSGVFACHFKYLGDHAGRGGFAMGARHTN